MIPLVPCAQCARHVRSTDAACPFCGTERTAAPPRAATSGWSVPLSRAALVFVGATAVAACDHEKKPTPPPTITIYGPPPIDEQPSAADAGVSVDDASDQAKGPQ